jgi:hypothetical protein
VDLSFGHQRAYRMAMVVPGIGGFVAGGAAGLAVLIAGARLLWATKTVWFERPDGDSLQYFDLMIGLELGVAVLVLPVVLTGGLVGAWLASRRSFPVAGIPAVGESAAEPSVTPDRRR